MKVNNIIKTAAVAVVGMMALTSCNDFLTIYPTDKTIGEDFWKVKSDVDNMVTGAYSAMIDNNVMERTLIWGEFRSDDVVKRTDVTNSDLDNISFVNLMPNNNYASWGSFYTVINRCNQVLKHAPEVLANDPDFQQGDYDEVRAQMLSLRALVYFYLVRTFRDVPYTTVAYEGDDQEMKIPQSTPDFVLDRCIEDLKEASRYIMRTGAYGTGDWRNKGLFTRDAVWATLCDIYLWKASMHQGAGDGASDSLYRSAIQYADMVINSKDAYYKANSYSRVDVGNAEDIYHLTSGSMVPYSIFYSGNDNESILEWQYDGATNANNIVRNYYHGSSNSGSSNPTFMASGIFAQNTGNNDVNSNYVYTTARDMRFWDNVYNTSSGEAPFPIRKYSTNLAGSQFNNFSSSGAHTSQAKEGSLRGDIDNYRADWVVYRLSDIMLMKAEAMVQLLNDSSSATETRAAFNLVKAVNDRSIDRTVGTVGGYNYGTMQSSDTLSFGRGRWTKTNLELLVLGERQRELCFEGKRWYDLMRYCYRHMTGVQPNIIMADRALSDQPALSSDMLTFMSRKYRNGTDQTAAQAITSKMKSEPYLYFPISENEMKVNTLLRQNPVFGSDESISKN